MVHEVDICSECDLLKRIKPLSLRELEREGALELSTIDTDGKETFIGGTGKYVLTLRCSNSNGFCYVMFESNDGSSYAPKKASRDSRLL